MICADFGIWSAQRCMHGYPVRRLPPDQHLVKGYTTMPKWLALLQRGGVVLKETLSGDLRESTRSSVRVMYHIALISLSAWIAVSLPYMAETFLTHWTRLQDRMEFIVTSEIVIAFLLIVFLGYLWRSLNDRKLAKMSMSAGLDLFSPSRGRLTQRTIARLKYKQGIGRNVMMIGSTGTKTFVDPQGDLHEVLNNCVEAKILLLNPYSEGARLRAKTLLGSVTPIGSWSEQVRSSVQFLKSLKATQKNIKLKLYSDYPHVKLVILGDYIWVQHYHATQDIQTMPEYVFKHTQKDHGLYGLFYQYFVKRWESPDIPEYDLATDELVYRNAKGIEERRDRFNWDGRDKSGTCEYLVPDHHVLGAASGH